MRLAAIFVVMLFASFGHASVKPLFFAACEGGFASGIVPAQLKFSEDFANEVQAGVANKVKDKNLEQLALEFQQGSLKLLEGANPYKLFEKLIYDLERALAIISPEGLSDVNALKEHLFNASAEKQVFANFDLRAARDQSSKRAALRVLAGLEWIGQLWVHHSGDPTLIEMQNPNEASLLIPYKRLNLHKVDNFNALLASIEKVISQVDQSIWLMPEGWRPPYSFAYLQNKGGSYNKIPAGSAAEQLALNMMRTLSGLSLSIGTTEKFFKLILDAIEFKLSSKGIDRANEINHLRSRFIVDPKYLDTKRFFGNQDLLQARATLVGLQPALRINSALQWVFRFWVHSYPESKLANEIIFDKDDPLQMGWRYKTELIVINIFLSEIGL